MKTSMVIILWSAKNYNIYNIHNIYFILIKIIITFSTTNYLEKLYSTWLRVWSYISPEFISYSLGDLRQILYLPVDSPSLSVNQVREINTELS